MDGNLTNDGLTSTEALLQSVKLNDRLTLSNRIVMAPMARFFADNNLVPTAEMAAYYGRRARAGLILTEAVVISPDSIGYPNSPAIFTQKQTDNWARVADAVHENSGTIFLQLWHVGRVSHPYYLNGELPVAPSAVPLSGRVPRAKGLEYGMPRALDVNELAGLVEGYVAAAQKALAAGFDGVEVHGGNGYLIDQFLHHDTNRREDDYGGSPENMCRFGLEVLDAVATEAGSDRVGMRLSPAAYMNLAPHPEDAKVIQHLLEELNSRDLAYVHEAISDDRHDYKDFGGRVSAFIRRHYQGTVIGCGSFTPEEANKSVNAGELNMVAFGRPFIANPDLVDKLLDGRTPEPYDVAMLKTLY